MPNITLPVWHSHLLTVMSLGRGLRRQRSRLQDSQSQNTTTGPSNREPGGLAVVCSDSWKR
jgi:hypothetical protein